MSTTASPGPGSGTVTSTSSTAAPFARAMTPLTTCDIQAPSHMNESWGRSCAICPTTSTTGSLVELVETREVNDLDELDHRVGLVDVVVDPVEGLRDGLLPVAERLLAGTLVHLRRP